MFAAFDNIDHSVLLKSLLDRYGIKGQAMGWVESYLSNRKQFDTIDSFHSVKHISTTCITIGDTLAQPSDSVNTVGPHWIST